MTLPAPTYDLVLMLDPQAEPDARAKIVADTRSSIEAGGELLRHDEWGERALTYPIDKKTSAEYHLLQFHAGSSELLAGLDRTLRITDGTLRFRIIKLAPGVAAAPDMNASAPAPVPARPAAVEAAPEAEPAVSEPVEPAEPAAAPEAAAEAEPAAAVAEPAS